MFRMIEGIFSVITVIDIGKHYSVSDNVAFLRVESCITEILYM